MQKIRACRCKPWVNGHETWFLLCRSSMQRKEPKRVCWNFFVSAPESRRVKEATDSESIMLEVVKKRRSHLSFVFVLWVFGPLATSTTAQYVTIDGVSECTAKAACSVESGSWWDIERGRVRCESPQFPHLCYKTTVVLRTLYVLVHKFSWFAF